MKIAKRLGQILRGPKPARNLVGRVLWLTGACRLFTIKRDGYQLRFFPTSLSLSYWICPQGRDEDEQVLRSFLTAESVFVDVGANVGTLTCLAASLVGPKGRVLCVEANPKTATFLRQNIALNGFDNVEVMNAAVGAESGHIYVTQKRADDMNVVSEGEGGLSVPLRRLDDVAQGYPKIDLLKIDVEGYERYVLQGAQDVLQKADVVMIEAYDENTRPFGYGAAEILKLLQEAGFTCYLVDRDRNASTAGEVFATCENVLGVRSVDQLVSRGYRIR